MQISLEEIKRLKIENSLKDKIIQSKEEKIQELEVKDTLPKQTHAQSETLILIILIWVISKKKNIRIHYYL